jgi:CubicO group peptidase (beta-lactamase class C family)
VLMMLGALVGLLVSDPVVTTRMLSMPFNGGSLGPEEVVAGGTPTDLPVATGADAADALSPTALKEAIAYGAATGSHALLVWHRGRLVLEHYYPGHPPEQRSGTQSMHKSVLALLFGIAIRDGHIASVDDPVARYLPEWRGDRRGAITLRQLLQQRSGLEYPPTNYLNPAGDFLQVMLGDQLEQTVLRMPVQMAPGIQFDYHNINVAVLGIVLQRATGVPYSRYLEEHLWQPLGADAATVSVDSTSRRTPRPYCCLDATARSWLLLGLLHLHEGRRSADPGSPQIVPAAWMQAITTPSPTNPNYGYLTWLGTTYEKARRYNHKSAVTARQSAPYKARDVRYFDGFGGQRVYVIPSRELVIVRTGDLAMDWDDATLPNLLSY